MNRFVQCVILRSISRWTSQFANQLAPWDLKLITRTQHDCEAADAKMVVHPPVSQSRSVARQQPGFVVFICNVGLIAFVLVVRHPFTRTAKHLESIKLSHGGCLVIVFPAAVVAVLVDVPQKNYR